MTRRIETAKKSHRPSEAHFDRETGAGVIVAKNKAGKLVALFFAPAATRDFEEVEISAHDRVNLAAMMKTRLTEDKARKTAPHDLEIGAIFHLSHGATFRLNTFWRVTAIPHPNKIKAVELPVKATWGSLEDGEVVPDLDAQMPPDARTATFSITMETGSASLKTTGEEWKLRHGERWNGKPQRNYQD